MLKRKRLFGPSFGTDGRRVATPTASGPPPCGGGGGGGGGNVGRVVPRLGNRPVVSNGHNSSSNKLFASGRTVLVQRAPIMSGLTCTGLSASVLKPFRRPKDVRRAKQKVIDEALKTSSLGMKRRFDGMARIMELSGKGLLSRGPTRTDGENEEGSTAGETSEEEEEEEDRPFEPLRVWHSPHGGGEPRGLPTRM